MMLRSCRLEDFLSSDDVACFIFYFEAVLLRIKFGLWIRFLRFDVFIKKGVLDWKENIDCHA